MPVEALLVSTISSDFSNLHQFLETGSLHGNSQAAVSISVRSPETSDTKHTWMLSPINQNIDTRLWLDTGFWLTVEFIELLELATANNYYNAIHNLHT